MSGNVQLLTLVSNGGGVGPGHSAICISGIVYTFEVPPWETVGPRTGWDMFKLGDYLKKNTQRPVYIQDLKKDVDPAKAFSYVLKSTDDYGVNGVCSQQVAIAINTAWRNGYFDPLGVDTPYKVYRQAKWLRLVVSERRVWSGRDQLPLSVRLAIEYIIFTNL